MKRKLCALLALILALCTLLCACAVDDSDDDSRHGGGGTTTTTKKSPKFEEIDLSNSDIAYFELTNTETDYVIISVEGYGEMLVRLFPDVAPETVKNFKKLVSQKFYDGLIFHRVIENFMIQGGGYTADLTERNTSSIKGEFSSNGVENNLLHVEGVLSMARTSVKDSASSQFFIMHKTSPHLDGNYAAFGYVVDGIEVVDAIAKVNTSYNDMPVEEVVISYIRFAEITVELPQSPPQITTTTTTKKPTGNTESDFTWIEDTQGALVYVTTDRLNVRSDTNTSDTSFRFTATYGQSFQRVKYNEAWTAIKYNDQVYYVNSEYVTTDPGYVVFTDDAAETTVYVIASSLNLRSSTNTSDDSNVKLSVDKNTALTRVATSANGKWIKVRVTYTPAGKTEAVTELLYCKAEFVSATAGADIEITPPAVG
ncbi:MAG: peptidylprolyl isomerase [Clostridia bacterium]|nr:peptidylprolyl isomerase [Clostridia bacterium]